MGGLTKVGVYDPYVAAPAYTISQTDLEGNPGLNVAPGSYALIGNDNDGWELLQVDISNPQNIWPHEVESFNEIGSEVFITLENIGLTLLRAISMYLNLDIKYFEDKVKRGESILRSIH